MRKEDCFVATLLAKTETAHGRKDAKMGVFFRFLKFYINVTEIYLSGWGNSEFCV